MHWVVVEHDGCGVGQCGGYSGEQTAVSFAYAKTMGKDYDVSGGSIHLYTILLCLG